MDIMFVSDKDFDIRKIAESGQCFRMNEVEKDQWLCIALDRVLLVSPVCGGYSFSCGPEEYEAFWEDYFDLRTDYSAIRRAIDPEDEYLLNAAKAGEGIRILRQDPWEMLITFIISQRKNIPAIKASVEAICRLFGEDLGFGIYAFPTPEALAWASEDQLKGCSLGYRVPYIMEAARMVSSGELDLAAIAAQSDEELLQTLQTVYGVGCKVANCVSLFGYHRIGAFPVDVWIKRVVDEHYSGAFPLERYEGFAGVLQQYMFYDARKSNEKKGKQQ